jgi:hypothetical protein
MKKSLVLAIGTVLIAFGIVGTAQAIQLTFFGEDIGPGDGTGQRLTATPHADTAQLGFFSLLLPGVATEGFDSFAAPTAIADLPPINFAQPSGNVTATLGGSGVVTAEASPSSATGTGLYPISSPNYLSTSARLTSSLIAFSLTFSQPQAALGFFGVDIGDFGGQVFLGFELAAGGTLHIEIPHTIGTALTTGGSVLYFGIIDTENMFTKVTFFNTTGTDNLAFDNFTIASASQVIPEPNTLLLLGSGLVLGGFARWRKKRTNSRVV